jgi:hypothetical protein
VDRPFQPGSSGLMFYGHDERPPVRELYGAFRRPPNDADRSAGELAVRTGALDRVEDDTVRSEGRLLLSGLGGELDMVYAVPVGDDQIAFAVLPNGGGMGHLPGPDGLLMLQHQTEDMDLVVHGIVADAVESVDLIVAGATLGARMGENAFGLWLEHTHEADLERVVLRCRDGTTNEIGLRPED